MSEFEIAKSKLNKRKLSSMASVGTVAADKFKDLLKERYEKKDSHIEIYDKSGLIN